MMKEITLLDKAEGNLRVVRIQLEQNSGDEVVLNIIAYLLQQAVELSLKYQWESKAQHATSYFVELKRIEQALPEVEESVRMCRENCKPFLGKSEVFN